MERLQWARFQIGAAFPADSILARWVAGLTMIANDLIHTNVTLINTLDSGNAAESSDATFYFWLACAQYREAAEFLRQKEPPEVASFVAQLSPETLRHRAEILPSFTPFPGSFVDTVLRPLRNRLFHYPKASSEELRSALAAASLQVSGVRVMGEEKVGNVRGVFADEVRARLLGGYLHATDAEREIRETMKSISGLMSSLIAFAHGCLTEYLIQLPPGLVTVDSE